MFGLEANSSDPMNFSGSASDLMSAMKAAGIQEPEAAAAAVKVAEAPASAPEACKDPECSHDHSHAEHDHSHRHGHDHKHEGTKHEGTKHEGTKREGNKHEGGGCGAGADGANGAACTDAGHSHSHGHGHAHADSDDDEEEEEEQDLGKRPLDDDGTPAENALRDNIARKGKNAYYYAHARSADAPKWDGHEAPRLLEKKPAASAEGGGGAADGAAAMGNAVVKKLVRFAWSDEKDKVKVYVSFKDNGLAADAAVDAAADAGAAGAAPSYGGVEHTLTHTETSVCLRLTQPPPPPPAGGGGGGGGGGGQRPVVHQLDLVGLYEPIAGAKAKVRKDKVILTLTKPPDACFTWHDLKKAK